MTKIIEITGSVQEWIHSNSGLIHAEILEACERGIENHDDRVDVVVLKTKRGLTKFVLDGKEKVLDSLKLAMDYYVRKEEYELAARVRDCISNWEKEKTK